MYKVKSLSSLIFNLWNNSFIKAGQVRLVIEHNLTKDAFKVDIKNYIKILNLPKIPVKIDAMLETIMTVLIPINA